MLEKTLESPLDWEEIQPAHFEGDQPWDFFGRNDAKAETPVLWPPDAKSCVVGKDSDAGRDWGQEDKVMTEDGWMASLTQWTWVWVSSRSWWWTVRPGMLRFMGLHWTELNWTDGMNFCVSQIFIYWCHNSHCDSTWKWGLWELIIVRWVHEGRTLVWLN